MKKVTSFAIAGLFVMASVSLSGCGRSGGNTKVELEGTSPPPALNQVQMEEYSKQMSSQGKGSPGN